MFFSFSFIDDYHLVILLMYILMVVFIMFLIVIIIFLNMCFIYLSCEKEAGKR